MAQTKTQDTDADRKRRGRPSYKATKQDREQVQVMTGLGLTADDICNVMGFSRATLFKYFKPELSAGNSVAKSKVAQSAFKMATGEKHPAMTMFWLKCRAGWRETQVNTHDELPPVVVKTTGTDDA